MAEIVYALLVLSSVVALGLIGSWLADLPRDRL